jgi:transmembrane sensor
MDELARKVAATRQRLSLDLGNDRVARLADRFEERLQRRRSIRMTAKLATGLAAAAAIAVLSVRTIRTHTLEGARSHELPSTPAIAMPLHVPDGSSVTPLDDLTVVQIKESSSSHSVIELVRGGARFNVTHNPSRLFRVEAGVVTVDVLGTEFTVERIGPRVRVSVLRGQVQVGWSERTALVIEGETGIFPRQKPGDDGASSADLEGEAPGALADDSITPNGAASSPHAGPSDHTRAGTSSPWRSLAAQRNFNEAYNALRRDGWDVPNNPSDLLLSADVARMSHHPSEAIPPLRRVVEQYSSDPRAPAAAFTLGRVLMETGAPRQAALAFAKAGTLDHQGTIVEDALAREVEAWSRAGDVARAHKRAEDYVARYPSGLRLASVRQYGGL